jgi:hypothetical protein
LLYRALHRLLTLSDLRVERCVVDHTLIFLLRRPFDLDHVESCSYQHVGDHVTSHPPRLQYSVRLGRE